MRGRLPLVLLALLVPTLASAQALADRASAGGYFRIMGRPDFMGGDGRLGYWNLYGRLMNEGPYAALELKLDLVPSQPGSDDAWAAVQARIDWGGAVVVGGSDQGPLPDFRLTQLYLRAGNVLFDDVVWQLGTIAWWFGDLGLYDARPAQLFDGVLGLSARWDKGPVELLVGIGDRGLAVRGLRYVPLLTAGGAVRVRLGSHLEVGGGGQVSYEPFIEGSRNSSYVTPVVNLAGYEDYKRGEIVRRFLERNPGQESLFPDPVAASLPSVSWRAIGYLGFGALGPLVWDNVFVSYARLHPQLSTFEDFGGRSWELYTADVTRDRYTLTLGNEAQFKLVPGRLDAVWSVLYGLDRDYADTLSASDANRMYVSTVLRLQGYLTRAVHVLLEGVLAHERSLNGNLYREHFDSVFQSSGGLSDTRGLEFGDSAIRNTAQLKVGPVLNPSGFGVFSRPSIRLLYGFQVSSQQAAWGNAFVESLDQFNSFPSVERHWHHLVSLEAEAWF